jgi:peptidoglycan-associated lipoprotein
MKKLLALMALTVALTACGTTSEDENAMDAAATDDVAASTAMTNFEKEAGVQMLDEQGAKAKDRVFFAFDQSTLSRNAIATLNAQVALLKANPRVRVVIEGHADERGTREYNLALGERRANSVKNFLVSKGVSSSRIKIVSYGKERPHVLGNDEAAWSQNRRAVTVVSK